MVDKNGIGLRGDGGLNQGATGRDTADDQLDLTVPFHLQAIGAVIAEFFGLEQQIKGLSQGFGSGHWRRLSVLGQLLWRNARVKDLDLHPGAWRPNQGQSTA